jgi:hypothetical protein
VPNFDTKRRCPISARNERPELVSIIAVCTTIDISEIMALLLQKRRWKRKMPFSRRKMVEISLAALAFLSFVAPDNHVFAFSQANLVNGGSIWLETTIVVALAFVSANGILSSNCTRIFC